MRKLQELSKDVDVQAAEIMSTLSDILEAKASFASSPETRSKQTVRKFGPGDGRHSPVPFGVGGEGGRLHSLG